MKIVVHLPDTHSLSESRQLVAHSYENATVNYNYDDYIVVSHALGRCLYKKQLVQYVEEFV